MKRVISFAPSYDAIIVGARCAGAATAMLLARQGARVLVVDWAEPGSDTLSTHAIMRGGVMQLERWGLLDTIWASGTPQIRKTTFQYGQDITPLALKPSFGVEALAAPRRSVLDSILVRAAREAGVDVRFGIAFRDVVRNSGGSITGAVLSDGTREFEVRSGLIIGADGRRSRVARAVDAGTQKVATVSSSTVYAYYTGIPDDGSHWYYSENIGAGKIPTNDNAHCVFFTVSMDRYRRQLRGRNLTDAMLEMARETDATLFDLMMQAEQIEEPLSFAGQMGHVRQAWGSGWALVGDAGYFRDPLTAHGITDALRDAEILADAVGAGTQAALEDYQTCRDMLARDMFDVSNQIAAFDWSLSDLKTMHLRLNGIMKTEQYWMSERFAPVAKAA